MPLQWALAYHKSVSDGMHVFVGTLFPYAPSTVKNFETRCDGLSPALFLFTITGNCTFALSICMASTKRRYLLANAPWLAGSVIIMLCHLRKFTDITLCWVLYREPLDYIS